MSKFISAVKTFIADEDGVTALEYGMIAALIAVAIAISVKALGGGIASAFDEVTKTMPKPAP